MEVAKLAASRSTCDRAMVGCVLVKDRQIISTGYNGSPPGMPHCLDVGHLLVEGHCMRTVHAEQNAVAQAAMHGISTSGAVAYVTHTPCQACEKLLDAAGVERVIIGEKYRREALDLTGLEFIYVGTT